MLSQSEMLAGQTVDAEDPYAFPDEDEFSSPCNLCEEQFSRADLSAGTGGYLYCEDCTSAIRAHYRAYCAKGYDVPALRHQHKHNQPEWRKGVLPFKGSQKQRAEARTQLTSFTEEFERSLRVTGEVLLEDELCLDLEEFITHMIQRRRQCEKLSAYQFNQIHTEQQGKYDAASPSGTVQRITFKDIPRLRRTQGTSHEKGVAKHADLLDDDYQREKARRTASKPPMPDASCPRPSQVPKPAPLAPAPAAQPPRRLTGKRAAPLPGDVLGEDGHSVAVTDDTAGAGEEAPQQAEGAVQQPPPKKQKKRSDKMIEALKEREIPCAEDVKKLAPHEFMQVKTQWKEMMEFSLKVYTDGEFSYMKKLEALKAQVVAEMETDLDQSTAELYDIVKTLTQEVSTVAGKVKTSTRNNLENNLTQGDRKIEELCEMEVRVQKHLKALDYIWKAEGQSSRQAYMTHYHVWTKIVTRLRKGAFPTKLADVIARCLYARRSEAGRQALLSAKGRAARPLGLQKAYATNPAKVDHEAVALFTKGSAVHTEMTTWVNNLKEAFDAAVEVVEDDWRRLGKKWFGSLVRIEKGAKHMKDNGVFEGGYLNLDDGAASPWLMTVRIDAYRQGPAAFPLCGFAAVVSVHRDGCHFLVLSVMDILDNGIALQSLTSFLQSPEGATLASTEGVLVTANAGDFVHVPLGFIALPLWSPASAPPKTPGMASVAHNVVLPLLHLERMKAVDQTVMNAVRQLNIKYLEGLEKKVSANENRLAMLTGIVI